MFIDRLEENEIFVFGSNSMGMHAGGAAKYAFENFGAIWGQGHGLQGKSYAIDTMSGSSNIVAEVETFLTFAKEHPELRFMLTEIGCNIAGYNPDQIGPLFTDAPENVVLPPSFIVAIYKLKDQNE